MKKACGMYVVKRESSIIDRRIWDKVSFWCGPLESKKPHDQLFLPFCQKPQQKQ